MSASTSADEPRPAPDTADAPTMLLSGRDIRELAEEIGLRVEEPCLAPLTFASHAYEGFHLLMPLYLCRRWEGWVRPLEGQRLRWVRPRSLRDLPMPPADLPLIPALVDLVG